MTADNNNTIEPGKLLADSYEVIRLISTGDSSAVYLAKHILTLKIFAIKVLLSGNDLNSRAHSGNERAAKERFQCEARCLAKIVSPNVVKIHDLGMTESGIAYLVMDYIEGDGLDKIIDLGPISCSIRFRSLFGQACDALQAVHEQGIVHRDVCPANFLVARTPTEAESLSLIAFRFAQATNEQASGELVGDPLYRSPEHCMGLPCDARSDIYSLGCTMFTALAGTPPFQGSSDVDTMSQHIAGRVTLSTIDMPDFLQLKAVILRCLEKRPEDRFQTVADLKLALIGNQVKVKPSGFLRGILGRF